MATREFGLSLGVSAAPEWQSCMAGTYYVKQWGAGGGWITRKVDYSCRKGFDTKFNGSVKDFSGFNERTVGCFETEELAKAACDQRLRELGAIRDPLLKDGKRHVVCVVAMRRGIDDRGVQRTYNNFHPFPDAVAVRAGHDFPLGSWEYSSVSLPHSLVLEGDTEVRAAQRAVYEQLGWETEARFFKSFMTGKVGEETWTTYVYVGPWFRTTAWVEWWGLLNKSPEKAYNRKLYELNSSIPAVTDTVEAALQRHEHQRWLENQRQPPSQEEVEDRMLTSEESQLRARRREFESRWRPWRVT